MLPRQCLCRSLWVTQIRGRNSLSWPPLLCLQRQVHSGPDPSDSTSTPSHPTLDPLPPHNAPGISGQPLSHTPPNSSFPSVNPSSQPTHAHPTTQPSHRSYPHPPFHTHAFFVALEKTFPTPTARSLMRATRALLVDRVGKVKREGLTVKDLDNVRLPS
jgi:hypothetical protein